jgi:hypothetical protein
MAYKAVRRIARIDIESGGTATISGVVKELTTPVSGRTVFLVRQEDMRVCRRTVSGAAGAYSFPSIATATEWLVLAIDPNAAYNAVVADRVLT